ncbi:MAG TPA: phosphatase PAP2-related protein [Candidatus Paceibacterota bacterium]|nr:phosphatase PAP2-related protein [Candidatus Paceibacterota bacterium]
MSLYKDRAFLKSIFIGGLMLAASIVAVFYSTNYATQSASNSVTDIILSNTPAFDVDGLFVYGAITLVAFIIVLLIVRPRYIPFSLKSVALFTFIRSISVSLTHISPYPYHATLDPNYFITSHFFRIFFTGDDLFFSGHTGLPFLMALIFWDKPLIRYAFLAASVVLGTAVLLGHLHYSIDVFSAYFITYAIFIMATRFFKADYARAQGSPALPEPSPAT